ncbi:PTS family sugar transport protein component IIB [Salmonella enterica subsp. enterica serovar Typhi]|nr:PTS family sugar transport protein component IIB [Salmonella enterica subsp. enterica serovar Typhi]
MRHVYVASHGPFARGLINSLSLLIGDEHGVTPVCAYDGDIVSPRGWPSLAYHQNRALNPTL